MLALTKKERMRQAAIRWRIKEPERFKQSQRYSKLKAAFGLSKVEYETMLGHQQGLCAICGQPEKVTDPRIKRARMLAVDHDHITKSVRGLLCTGCNQGLGKFRDSIDLLSKALEYLRRFYCSH